MLNVILKDGTIIEDTYQTVTEKVPQGDVLLTVEQLDLLPEITGKKAIFVTPDVALDQLPLDVDAFFIDFAGFNDGRGYSTATLLRRYGFKGELRAVGDIFKDVLNYLKRSGFDSFTVKEGKDIADTAKGLQDFKVPYQKSLAVTDAHYQTGKA